MNFLERHREAMRLLDSNKNHEAFEIERDLAMDLKERYDLEPTRSIVFQAAALIAHKAGLPDEEERLWSQVNPDVLKNTSLWKEIERKASKQNSITVIHPYRHAGGWAFDDERVGLFREPFVSGVPEIIDRIMAAFGIQGDRISLYFSPTEFPGYHRRAVWMCEEHGGNWYSVMHADRSSQDGWLCPALFKYFDEAPACLYIMIKETPCT